jgi:hypothetical protein
MRWAERFYRVEITSVTTKNADCSNTIVGDTVLTTLSFVPPRALRPMGQLPVAARRSPPTAPARRGCQCDPA